MDRRELLAGPLNQQVSPIVVGAAHPAHKLRCSGISDLVKEGCVRGEPPLNDRLVFFGQPLVQLVDVATGGSASLDLRITASVQQRLDGLLKERVTLKKLK